MALANTDGYAQSPKHASDVSLEELALQARLLQGLLLMKLYDAPLAPNPRRVRIFLAEKGIEVPRVEIDIVGGENLGADFLAINPRGLLPTLVLDDGTTIDESVAISRYFEELQPDPPLMGTDPRSRALVGRWQRLVEFDGGIPVAEAFRNSAPNYADRAVAGRTGDPAIPELAARGRARLQAFYDQLDTRLTDVRYIAGGGFTIADITALCIIDFARAIKLGYGESRPHLARWHTEVRERPSSRA
jgi:glutathione S-transferase